MRLKLKKIITTVFIKLFTANKNVPKQSPRLPIIKISVVILLNLGYAQNIIEMFVFRMYTNRKAGKMHIINFEFKMKKTRPESSAVFSTGAHLLQRNSELIDTRKFPYEKDATLIE